MCENRNLLKIKSRTKDDEFKANYIRIENTDYDQIRIILCASDKENSVSADAYERYDEQHFLQDGTVDWQRGIIYRIDNKAVLKILVDDQVSKIDSLMKYLFGSKIEEGQTTTATILLTKEILYGIFPNSDEQRRIDVANAINKYSDEFEITTIERMAHFLGQIGAETGGLKDLKEGCNYTAKNVFDTFLKPNLINHTSSTTGKTFKYCDLIENVSHSSLNTCPYSGGCDSIVSVKLKKNDEGNDVCAWEFVNFGSLYTVKSNYIGRCELFDYVYGCRMGNGVKSTQDGSTYLGKGFIHLTGKDNYKAISDEWNRLYPNDTKEFHGADISLLETDIDVAIKASMIYWKINRLNSMADAGTDDASIDNVGRLVNGSGTKRPNGADTRIKYTTDALTNFK